jgi:hypothetical protein
VAGYFYCIIGPIACESFLPPVALAIVIRLGQKVGQRSV